MQAFIRRNFLKKLLPRQGAAAERGDLPDEDPPVRSSLIQML